MNKSDYRALFVDLQKYVKIYPFLKELKISQSNFSYFMHGSDRSMSIQMLDTLYSEIQDRIQKIA